MGDVIYSLAKYVPDLMRQEPRNVGVIVADESTAVMRFLGQRGERLDLRGARLLQADSGLYADWYAYWERQVQAYRESARSGGGDPEAFLNRLAQYGDMFSVAEGGEFAPDEEGQSLEEMAEELFQRLVRPLDEQRALAEGARKPAQLFKEIRREFRHRGLLAADTQREAPEQEHLIRVRAPVPGTQGAKFRPNFSQMNGHLTIMENVDYSILDGERATEHALYTASMFVDVREANAAAIGVDLIVIVQAQEGMNENAQRAGRAAFNRVGDVRLVPWYDQGEKEQFLRERAEVAGLR